jgi:plastocyanin
VRRLIWLIAAGSLVVVPAAYAGLTASPTEILVKDNAFDPAAPPAQGFHSGASFHWQRDPTSTGNHSVTQDAKLFSSGDPTTGPIDLSVNASAGTYHYYCQVHGSPGGSPSQGMNGIVKVAPLQTGPLTRGEFDTFGVKWADANTTTGSLYDVRYRIGGGPWTIWLNDTAKTHAVFGNHDKPAKVRPHKVYKVAVRSEKTNTAKHSGWSPPMSYELTGP